jgi:CHAT domain
LDKTHSIMKNCIYVLMMSFCLPVYGIAQQTDSAESKKKEMELYYFRLSLNLNDSLRLNPMLSEKVVAKDKQKFQKSFDKIFSFLENNSSKEVLGSVYDNILLFHNASIDREIALRQKIQYTDSKTRQLFQTRDSLLNLLGKQYELPTTVRQNTVEFEITTDTIENTILKNLKKSTTHFRALSIALAQKHHERYKSNSNWDCYQKINNENGNPKVASQLYKYAKDREKNALTWQRVRDVLTEDEVAIEFIFYHSTSNEKNSEVRKYGALVLRRNDKAPTFVSLCTQSQLDSLLHNDEEDAYYFLKLYTIGPNNDFPSLYKLIWQPIEPLIKGIKKVHYAPSGDLHRINIGAIYAPETETPLHQQIEFISVNSARSLINIYEAAEGNQPPPSIKLPCDHSPIVNPEDIRDLFPSLNIDNSKRIKTRDIVLFGNIFYDMDSSATKNPKNKIKNRNTMNRNIRKKRAALLRGGKWEHLEGTHSEIASIQKIFRKFDYDIMVQEGYAASEESFKVLGKNKNSPRIIHLATHGFFFATTQNEKQENPLNLSGLILAGANHAWQTGYPKAGMEDGILTAFEIGQMNLQNTELVVLSACETGLGYIENNEGVFGLQRAFKQAGVQNLIVSLWGIPDDPTQLFMTQFYKNCFEKDKPLRIALKETQNWMRQQQDYRNPYYWAGFVLLE